MGHGACSTGTGRLEDARSRGSSSRGRWRLRWGPGTFPRAATSSLRTPSPPGLCPGRRHMSLLNVPALGLPQHGGPQPAWLVVHPVLGRPDVPSSTGQKQRSGPCQMVRGVSLLTLCMEPRETRLSGCAVCNGMAPLSAVVSHDPARLARTRVVPPPPCTVSGPLGILRRSLTNENPKESTELLEGLAYTRLVTKFTCQRVLFFVKGVTAILTKWVLAHLLGFYPESWSPSFPTLENQQPDPGAPDLSFGRKLQGHRATSPTFLPRGQECPSPASP